MGYFGIPFRNGVPIGLGSVASFGAQQFDPSSLFLGGTVGTFYDPSDPTTLFTTSTGTTPCAVPGSGSPVLVGLMLDKSQGAPGALGAELVTNGDFSNGTTGWSGWNTNAQISVTNGQMTVTQPVGGNQVGVGNTVAYATVVGRAYQISLDIISYNNSGLEPQIRVGNFNGSVNTISFNLSAGTGRKTGIFVANSTTTFVNVATSSNAGNTITFDNISVLELPGNHAIAFNDTTARPELSARVNLLTYSEQFDDGAWTKSNATITANATVAPDGTTTGDKLIANTTSAIHFVNQSQTPTASTAFTMSAYAKSGEYAFLVIQYDAGGVNVYRTFNLATGALGATSGGTQTATIISVGDGWYRCVLSFTTTSITTGSVRYWVSNTDSIGPYAGDGTSGIFIWGADLRPANIGSAIPSYQRIADQYTYDNNGFPSYLRFDGVDDSMYTPASINFSGTDKMSVFAGVRKLSDAALGVVAETSVDSTVNNGSWWLLAPYPLNYYSSLSRGTAFTLANSTNIADAAPQNAALTALLNIGAPSNQLRVNGAIRATETSSQGTGNYGTYPLYIGSRNNSSLRFNGHLYSLIIAGTQLQSGSIAATEQYVAGKTGVQI